jgi:cytochrome c biogenesis protein
MDNKKGVMNTLKQDMTWKFLASIKLTVVLLFVLAAASIIGTFIPQNDSLSAYVEKYGVFVYKIFFAFDLFDLYHSWWFQVLLTMLTLNIIVCSIDRLHSTWRIIFPTKTNYSVSRFKASPNRREFVVNAPPDQLLGIYKPETVRGFGYQASEDVEDGFFIYCEKGRWTRLGVYAVHLSVVLLLLGGLVGSIFGFEGFVNIGEGETAGQITLRQSGKMQPLDFQIRCDDFFVSFYESGAPEEFRSSLSIIDNGRLVLEKDIIVNDPLRFRGINIFQSSYGRMPTSEVTLNFESRESGMIYPIKMSLGERVDLPEGMGEFVLTNFIENYSFMQRPLGEAFIGTMQDEGEPVEVAIPVKFPGFDKMRKGKVVITVDHMEERYYTGLQVTSDPGVGIVYAGFLMMIIGFIVTFYLSHQRIGVYVSHAKENGTSRVLVAGIANKNKRGMELYVKRLAERLEKTGI